MNVLTAGRLLKSAVVFLTRTSPSPAPPVTVRILTDYCRSFIQNHQQDHHPPVPAGKAVVVDAAAVPAVPVIINSKTQGEMYEERFHLYR
jgi:hypothetical protein